MDYYKQEIEAEEQQKPRPAIPLLKTDDPHGFSKRDSSIDKKAAIFKVTSNFSSYLSFQINFRSETTFVKTCLLCSSCA